MRTSLQKIFFESQPPVAPTQSAVGGSDNSADDEFAWLRDPQYPNVQSEDILNYLGEENRYTESFIASHQSLYEQLLQELKARISENDASVPARYGPFFYKRKYTHGQQYPVIVRIPEETAAEEKVLVDLNTIDTPYLKLGTYCASPNHKLFALTLDPTGDERFDLWMLDTASMEMWVEIHNVNPEFSWSADSQAIFYTQLDEEWRPNKIFLHQIKSEQTQDSLILEEQDPRFSLGVSQTQSESYILLESRSKTANEIYIIPSDAPHDAPKLICKRRDHHEYALEHAREYTGDHGNDIFFILTNDFHPNFRLVKCSTDHFGEEHWTEILGASDAVYLSHFLAFKDHLVLFKKKNFLTQVSLLSTHSFASRDLSFPDPCYEVHEVDNLSFDANFIRLEYSSPVTPRTIYDFQLEEDARTSRKVQTIPSGYRPQDYTCEFIMAQGRDGTQIPVSLVYKTALRHPGQPLYLYGYGSYGYGVPDAFSAHRLSLLDRGFIFAIAHIRGGDEGGKAWHEMGRLKTKWNTFYDFIDVADHLIAQGYTAKGKIACMGGSAGGMLVGATINTRPDLFCSAIAHVPFVDVLNTMLDATLPLTPPEYLEWGNPSDPDTYDLIKSYSPYDNIKAQDYPHLLVTAGLHDPRVTYWEPAKWVARLRSQKTDANILLLKTNMESGHGGKSGRYAALDELALEYTFILTTIQG